jgi:hypothetical protein
MNRKKRQEVARQLDNVLLIKVVLPPLEKYNIFQLAKRRSIFLIMPFQ